MVSKTFFYFFILFCSLVRACASPLALRASLHHHRPSPPSPSLATIALPRRHRPPSPPSPSLTAVALPHRRRPPSPPSPSLAAVALPCHRRHCHPPLPPLPSPLSAPSSSRASASILAMPVPMPLPHLHLSLFCHPHTASVALGSHFRMVPTGLGRTCSSGSDSHLMRAFVGSKLLRNPPCVCAYWCTGRYPRRRVTDMYIMQPDRLSGPHTSHGLGSKLRRHVAALSLFPVLNPSPPNRRSNFS